MWNLHKIVITFKLLQGLQSVLTVRIAFDKKIRLTHLHSITFWCFLTRHIVGSFFVTWGCLKTIIVENLVFRKTFSLITVAVRKFDDNPLSHSGSNWHFAWNLQESVHCARFDRSSHLYKFLDILQWYTLVATETNTQRWNFEILVIRVWMFWLSPGSAFIYVLSVQIRRGRSITKNATIIQVARGAH